jgi:prepilin-type N-terminal cleavage/methylation domain-containing protein
MTPSLPGSADARAGVRRSSAAAFTLLEIMIVAVIIGMIMAAGVPTLYRALKKEGFRKVIVDVMEVCENARGQAILQGQTREVEFRPLDGTCQIVGGSAGGGLAHRAVFGENVAVEMLDVNLTECRAMDSVRVRFFPNGTCDEMTLVLRSDRNEWRKISLEITTALARLETDPAKFDDL